MARPVLHVVVVGFHHQRGSEVEFAYPSLIDEEPSSSRRVPDEWKFLPFVALPDGAHNYEQDFAFFHLPGKVVSSGDFPNTVFGISCCRQIDSKDLKIKGDDITRTTVQKSVCVLCQLPLYGYVQTKLEAATRIYFEERDFSKTHILEELYRNLNASLSSNSPGDSLSFIGLSAVELVTTFRQRIIVHGFPVAKICSQLLSLVSLFPGMLQKGLHKSAHICKLEGSFPEDTTLDVDVNGLPLAIFTKLTAGGTIEVHDPELNDQLSLSTADLRFTDYLMQHVSPHGDGEGQEAGWDGSDEWIRAQFKLYLLSLLSTMKHTDGESMRNYNEDFVAAWKRTNNFHVWQTQEHDAIDEIHAGHPFQGQMSLSDVKIRLSNVMKDGMQTAQGKRLGQAVAQTGKAVGGAISSARSFMSSWLSNLAQGPNEQTNGEEDNDLEEQ